MVKFTNPPLSEVSFSVEFSAHDLASVHQGLYWQTIRSEFPTYFDRPPIPSPLANTLTFTNLPPLRRVWYESSDRHQLIQLQSDRFIYNWRRLDSDHEYPSFEVIFPLFLGHWQKFETWWQSEIGRAIQPMGYSLTYTNEIGQGYGWSGAEDHHKIFTLFNPQSISIPNTRLFNVNLEIDLGNNIGILAINLYEAINNTTNSKVAYLELTAITDSPSDPTAWFKQAHSSIIDNFLVLITTQAKQDWGLYE
jgi:uncharacterized protein (TIGR04255 family)